MTMISSIQRRIFVIIVNEGWTIIYQLLDQLVLERLLEIVSLNEGNREIEDERMCENARINGCEECVH